MPDNPPAGDGARRGPGAASSAAGAAVVSGLAVGDRGAGSAAARAALREAGITVGELSAVIHVGPIRDSLTAASVCAGLGIVGVGHGVRALDLADDGCGVPSSIAVGSSLLNRADGAVLVTVGGGALVLTGTLPGPPRPETSDHGGRGARAQPPGGRQGEVERVLSRVGDGLPIVAVLPAGLRHSPGRRFALLSPPERAATPVDTLLAARSAGYPDVVLVTADCRGRAASVVCHFGVA